MHSRPTIHKRFWTAGVWQVLLIALVVRSTWLVAKHAELQKDPDAYRHLAEALVQKGSYSWDENRPSKALGSVPISDSLHATAFRPPLYPILLSIFALPTGTVPIQAVAGLHLILGLATVLLVYDLARRLCSQESQSASNGERIAFWAAVLVACDPLLLNQSSLVMTETLVTFFAILLLWLWNQSHSESRSLRWLAMAGLCTGLACLARPTFLPWGTLLILGALVCHSSEGVLDTWLPQKSAWKRAAIYGLAMLLPLLLWGGRNALVFGTPIITTTHGGYTLWLANNPEFYQYLRGDRSGLPWQSTKLDETVEANWQELFKTSLQQAEQKVPRDISPHEWAARKTELALNQKLQQQGKQQLLQDPAGAVQSSLYRLGSFFRVLPSSLQSEESSKTKALRYITAVWFSAIYLLAVIGLVSLRRNILSPTWLAAFALVVTLAGIHTLYFSNLRMRAPLVPIFALLAAYGSMWLLRQFDAQVDHHERRPN